MTARSRYAAALRLSLAVACSAVFLPVGPASAQAVSDGPGVVAAGLLIRQLDGVKRVLVIGAHPDDEDTALLTTLARGLGARAAYLSLTRGEGGQNLIGPELGEGLGIVRTGELLAARRLDGAAQYFTRAYDFGFSKNAEETFAHWPRDSLLRDVVWVVRSFRPHVIVSIFGGTPRDGHGQHQVAGLLAPAAFQAAGDPTRFADQLDEGVQPWSPLKLYRRTWRDPEATTLEMQSGTLDPLLGRSHFQVAMDSRSQHRSQDFGMAQQPGPHVTRLRLLDSRVSQLDDGLFAGIDTTLAGLAAELPHELRSLAEPAVTRYRDAVHRAAAELSALDPSASVPALATALTALRELQRAVPEDDGSTFGFTDVIQHRLAVLQRALLAAASITLSARADDDLLVPGQSLQVTLDLWNGGPFRVHPAEPTLDSPGGWQLTEPPAPVGEATSNFGPVGDPSGRTTSGALAPTTMRRWRARLRPAEDAPSSTPYYLHRPRDGDLYRWPAAPELRTLPHAPPLLHAAVEIEIEVGAGPGGPVSVTVSEPVRFRGVDKASGEFWRPVNVVPALSVWLEPGVLVWPSGDAEPRSVTVTLRSDAGGRLEGDFGLELPAGWGADPATVGFSLIGPGATVAYSFRLLPPDEDDAETASARLLIRGVATTSDGQAYGSGVDVIDYPHIDPVPLRVDATVSVLRIPVRVAQRRVGYLMGSGDVGPDAIRQMGLNVEMIEPSAIDASALDRFDVIVLGVRSYEVQPDLVTANEDLLEWVRRGGVLVIQYNKYEFSDGKFAPFLLEIDRPAPRVTDETATITLLDPDAPVFTTPNRITAEDFQGWVQERGLYFPTRWDDRFTPLIETSDAGEAPTRGSLLIAPVGSGAYVYTSLSFFRQFPAGVAGAYRLFANLVSLDPAAWSEYARRTADDRTESR